MAKFIVLLKKITVTEPNRGNNESQSWFMPSGRIPLKRAVQMIGVFQSVFSLAVIMFLSILAWQQTTATFIEVLPDSVEYDEIENSITSMPLFLVTTSLMITMHLAVNLYLIIGAKTANIMILKIWIFYTLTHITFAGIHSLLFSCWGFEFDDFSYIIPLAFITLYEVICLYFCLIVHTFYNTLLERKYIIRVVIHK